MAISLDIFKTVSPKDMMDAMRRPPRIQLSTAAMMIAEDGYETSVTILDISARGFRIEHNDDLHVGDFITLVISSAERLRGSIKWSIGREAGGIFVEAPTALD